jgi:Zn-dependent protease with chaperone function
MKALPSSHPSLEARIARLQKLESGLQHPRH